MNNPLLESWKTPFEAPPFDLIRAEHFRPAFTLALAAHRDEIAAVAQGAEAPTFANTIVALERSGEALRKVRSTFRNLASSNGDDELLAIEREISPVLAAHNTDIYMNPVLFGRVDALWSNRENLGLDAERLQVLKRYHKAFVRTGARLDANQRARMAQIAQRLAVLGTQFSQNVLKDESSWLLLLEESDLAGLPPAVRAACAALAQERGHPGQYAVSLSRSSVEPFLVHSERRDLREKLFKAWIRRGENGGPTDNRGAIAETLALRAERAQLLGYRTFAHFKLDDTMAQTPEAARELLERVWIAGRARALEERDELQALAHREGHTFALAPHDWRHFAEKLRREKFAIDDSELRAYLPLESVIAAAFDTAQRLFGLRFVERHDVPLYHPEVRAFDVRDGAGKPVALFLADYFGRTTKRSGAWMSTFRGQHKLDGEVRPIVVNVMNFVKGGEGEQTLLGLDEARTLFHEFGHALHGMLSDVTFPSIACTSVATDFVELPSQLYEHWLLRPEVLRRFARHVHTGEIIPESLLDRLRAAGAFNQGFATVEFCASAIVDLDFHSLEDARNIDPLAFEATTLARIGMPDEIVMRHRSPHFTHVFAGDGYSSGYYSYLWSEVLDSDAFEAFAETGNVFDPGVAARLQGEILSAGGRREPAEAYVAFRGRLPSVEPLLKKRGFA